MKEWKEYIQWCKDNNLTPTDAKVFISYKKNK